MTQNCVSHASYASGSQFTGLTAGHALLRDDHGGLLGELPRGDDRAGRPDARHRPARDARHPGPRLRHGRRLDLGHRQLVQRPRRPALHRQGLHERRHDDRLRDHDQRRLGRQRHGPRLHPGLAGHRLLRDRHGPGLDGLPRRRPTSAVAGPQADTSLLNAPGTPTVAPSTTTAGAVTATFTNSSGPTVASYSATACTNAAMTAGCVSQAGYTSGAQLTGLVQGTKYYVTITAVSSSAAYAASTSAVSNPSVLATVQLATPTITSVSPSTTNAGQLTISYTGLVERPGRPDVLGDGLHELVHDDRLRHPGELHVRRAAHRPHGRHLLLRHHHRHRLGRLPPGDDERRSARRWRRSSSRPRGPRPLAYGSVAGTIAVTVSSSNAPAASSSPSRRAPTHR